MAQNWQNHQMVLNIGSEGTYDTTHAYGPTVIKDTTNYKMWYTGHDGTNPRIIYCDSTDGKTWSNHQMVVNIGAEGTYDINQSTSATVIKDGSTYKMWYAGYVTANNFFRIIYCDSTDGLTWSNHQMVVDRNVEGVYDTYYAYTPCVIKDGTTYKMWYAAYDGLTNMRIMYANSSNGINWNNHQMIIDAGSEGTYDVNWAYSPTVIKSGDTYKMWYTGNDGANYRTIYCDSTNGISWSNFEMVLDIGSEGTYDTSAARGAIVFKEDSLYKMWYAGSDDSNYRIIHTDWHVESVVGTLNDSARIMVIDEDTWIMESNEVHSTGSYSIDTTSGTKLIIGRREADGEIIAYGNVEY